MTNADDLTDCDALTFPVVLKAGWLAHKSEQRGIRLGIDSMDALRQAYDAMRALLGEGDYVVEEQDQRPHTVEMLVGARQDRDFGPVVMVGAGGYRDRAAPRHLPRAGPGRPPHGALHDRPASDPGGTRWLARTSRC